jgi:hypothetical protein
VWVGAEVEHFRVPEPASPGAAPGAPLRVLFYGQFIPLHGVDTIVEAARLMAEDPVSGRSSAAAGVGFHPTTARETPTEAAWISGWTTPT